MGGVGQGDVNTPVTGGGGLAGGVGQGDVNTPVTGGGGLVGGCRTA